MSLVMGNPELDFFEQNPVLKFKSEFKKIREDLSEGEASKVCWAIFMIEEIDETKNPLSRIPREQRIEEVRNTYYEIDIVKYKYLMDAYARLTMTKEQAMFKIHIDKLDELTAFLKDLSLDDDKDFNKYIRIMDKLPRMWDGLEKVKTKMIEKQSKTVLRGGAKQSAREKRKRRK